MNSREIEQLKKKTIYSIQINDDLKDSVIRNYLNEFNTFIKRESKKNKLLILVINI